MSAEGAATAAPAAGRRVAQIVPEVRSADVPGLALSRTIATPHLDHLDPFLLLSDFSPARPGQPVGGFGDHPHRGFETVTYMIDGAMHHRDHVGGAGVIHAGGVQWMTAGRGIIHAETPVPDDAGRLRGFQLWVNLPAADKMAPPAYQEYPADAVPVVDLPGGGQVRVIAGAAHGATGPVRGISVDPLYLDIALPAGSDLAQTVPAGHNTVAYVIDGTATVGGTAVPARHLAVLAADGGGGVPLSAGAQSARLLLIAARPLQEPLVRYGPFVMNTEAEIRQAFADFRQGRF